MRNLVPGPKFSILVATVVVITLAVSPFGYAEAEKISAVSEKEKRIAEEGRISLKQKRSLDFDDRGADKPAFYEKWETGTDIGDDDVYSGQADLSGSNSYEDDGYGYDDDEYDHFNFNKRYDSGKSKINDDSKIGNEESKGALDGGKRANVVVPEATTIELLSFQAKNMNPTGENMQLPKDDSKMKPFSVKKPPYSEKSEEKQALVEEKIKKKTSEEQKPDGNANDKNTGNVKLADNKLSDAKESSENKAEKGKVSDSGTTGSTGAQNLNENAQLAGGKENSARASDGKDEAKFTEKDLKGVEAKFLKEEKDGGKMKSEKEDMEARIDEEKVDAEAAKDESKGKNPSQIEANRVDNDYEDGYDNMNDPVIADDEKGSEDNGMNMAGLRDNRNELPYQYSNGFRPGKYIKKKETSRRAPGAHSGIRNSNWESKAHERENQYSSGPKEPFHLDFPVADLENTGNHRNYLQSLKRFNDMDESARILNQGDAPSPYADESKKYLAPKVIEEEQRKRRSRLRRLKANPIMATVNNRGAEEGDEAYDYDSPPRAGMQFGGSRGNMFGEGYRHISNGKNYRRRGSHLLRDVYGAADDLEEERATNTKNKRQDDHDRFYWNDEAYAEKRKSQGKSAWCGGESSVQKKKLKEANLYEEPGRYNTPLVLLQRSDNGQQAMKTFVDGRYKNGDGVDSEDLARLLSRDNNYVVLKKVPAKEQLQESNDGGISRSFMGGAKKEKFKISHLDVAVKAQQHSSDVKEPDIGKMMGALKEGHVDHSLKGKENRIEDLSDFFKGDVSDDKDFDEKKEMLMSIDNRLSQYQRGEPNKNVLYKPSLSQAYRHMKDVEEPQSLSDSGTNTIKLAEKKLEKEGNNERSPERLLKSFKKDGKEFLAINQPFAAMAINGKIQDATMQNLDAVGAANVVPNQMAAASVVPLSDIAGSGNIASSMLSNGMKMVGANMVPADTYLNGMMPSGGFQEIKLPEMQKGTDGNRKYFLYGPENDMASAPKHEIKVLEGGFGIPSGSPYNAQNYNQESFSSQNYNKPSSMKNNQGGKAQSLEERKGADQYSLLHQPYGYSKAQQCSANGYQHMNSLPATAEGFKRLAKKDKSSGGLERFMRDFQDFSQASYPNSYKLGDLSGMTLQELTGHGDRHLQKLNSFLKEIMSSKPDDTGNSRAAKNLKRGMFQKYKDQKNWPLTGGGGTAQVRSGKWTSLPYDGSGQTGYSDKSRSSGESSIKDRKLEGKDAAATLSKDTLLSKRTKRQSGYDSKDSTKILEQKVKSMPYNVQPQPLFPNANATGSASPNQQHKSPLKACIQLPPDKLMDLLNFIRSEREEFDKEKVTNEYLCKRSAPAEDKPARRKLLSVSEREAMDEAEKRKAECVRKSFESYLDPLVGKIGEYEMRTEGVGGRSSAREKREIDLDESMPNDFQNFLVTSLGSFGNQKGGVVKKDEAVWDSEGFGEESTLGKRETSGDTKAEKNSISKDDATNIRIKIVDGNGNGELEAMASGGTAVSRDVKSAEGQPDGDASVHEVYLITNADSKRRKKKKYANIRSDQSPQKQPISNHLPQVETVYNPSPGSNKAQVEKISGDTQLKGKCAQLPTVYNATASMMEDNIIRNNLRTGNINTFTYQHKEEPTPYPLQGPTNPPSSEFEMLNSKSLSRSKPFSNRVVDYGDRYASPGVVKSNPEIVYKDQNPQQYISNGLSMSGPGFRSQPMTRVIKSGAEGSGPDMYRKDYAEYEDGESFSENGSERQADDRDYEQSDSGRQGNRRQDTEEYPPAQEHLDPKMVALWNEYSRTHLSPERHKEAMEREFQEAYFRSSGQTRYVGGSLNQPNWGVNLIQNLNSNDFDRSDKQKMREKLSKRWSAASKPSGPVQIGQRFFYTFKSEVPDEEYYSLYQEPPNLKSSGEISKARLNEKSAVAKLSNRQQVKAKDAGRSNREESHGNRVKRSQDRLTSEEEPRIQRDLSPGQLIENNYRRFQETNSEVKREAEGAEKEEKRKRRRTEKRDSLADFLKADIMRRIEEEKKIRSKVKGLSSDLNKYDIPLTGGSSLEEEASLPDLLFQRLAEDKKKDKMTDQNPYFDDRQQQQQQPHQYGNLKSGSPDVFKTFEIKRGRREEYESGAGQKRTPSEGGGHAIVSRAQTGTYQDRIFLKGVKTRNVKKYSDEGFEPLTPDARFSEKSSFYSEESKASDGPYRVPLGEKESTSSGVNRRGGDHSSKVKEANPSNQHKFQKLTHGFSHEAPLLTPNSPLNSPKIFDALKDGPPSKEIPSLRKHPAETSLLMPADTRDRSRLKSSKAEAAKEPLVSAVLVLTKREQPRELLPDTQYPLQSYLRSVERSGGFAREEEERPSGVEKRKAEWPKDAGGDFSRFRPVGHSSRIALEPRYGTRAAGRSVPGERTSCGSGWNGSGEDQRKICRRMKHRIPLENFSVSFAVNEEGDCRSSECETPAKTANNKMVPKVKQSCFPFRQMRNDRNEDGNGIGNSGEDILESILGRVESNPHFRKVIGPGLKWRSRKCYAEAENCQGLSCQPPSRCLFVRQVRKILARFVRDIEALASQDFTRNVCCKLDCASNKFLHELLDVPFEAAGTCGRRKYLGSLLREPSGRAEEDTSLNSAAVETKENRRDLVARLLEEYRSLPEDEKRSVEVLGQYLNHELDTLNRALNSNGASIQRSDEQHEERATSSDIREGGEANAEKSEIASDAPQGTLKDSERAPARAPHAPPHPENPKSVKDDCASGCPRSSIAETRVVQHTQSSTENGTIGPSDECAKATPSFHANENKPPDDVRPGDRGRPGYSEAAGLRQLLKFRALPPRNLKAATEKSVDFRRSPKQQSAPKFDTVTDVPFPDESVEAAVENGERSDSTSGRYYHDYNLDDGYKASNAEAPKKRERSALGVSRPATP